MRNRTKKGTFASSLTRDKKEIIKKWIKSGIEKPRILGKIMLHFGVYEKTASSWLNEINEK